MHVVIPLCGTREIQSVVVTVITVCYSLTGSQVDEAVEYNRLEVGQTHSSEEAPEQNQTKFGGGGRGAKGIDREKVIQQK